MARAIRGDDVIVSGPRLSDLAAEINRVGDPEHMGQMPLQGIHRDRMRGVRQIVRHPDPQRHRRHPGRLEAWMQHPDQAGHTLITR